MGGTRRGAHLWIICYTGSLADVISLGPEGGNLTALNLNFIWKWGQSHWERTFVSVANSVSGFTEGSLKYKNEALFTLQTLNLLGGKESWPSVSLLCSRCFTKVPFNPNSTLWVYVPHCLNWWLWVNGSFHNLTKTTELENDCKKIQTQACWSPKPVAMHYLIVRFQGYMCAFGNAWVCWWCVCYSDSWMCASLITVQFENTDSPPNRAGWISVPFILYCPVAPVWLQTNFVIKALWLGLPWWRSGWESACQCRGYGFEPWSGKIPHATEQLGPWATITEPARLEPVLCNKRGHDGERPVHRDEEWPPLATARESPRTETKTQHSHK